MRLSSTAFEDGELIPPRYTHQGVHGGLNISIPLAWDDPPEGVRSYAVSIVDPHPVARNWAHWLVLNIPSSVVQLEEGASGKQMPRGSKELQNSYGEIGYGGPEPPRGSGPHPYVVTVYALSADSIALPVKAGLDTFLNAVEEKTIETAVITGIFEQ